MEVGQSAGTRLTASTDGISSDGEVFVRFAGWRNRSAGPDFRDAVIEADGVTVRGDVEVHRDARDWVRHGHDVDPKYKNVVLHIVGVASDDPPGPARWALAASLGASSAQRASDQSGPAEAATLTDVGRRPTTAVASAGLRSPFACHGLDARDVGIVRDTLRALGAARYRVTATRIATRLAAIADRPEQDDALNGADAVEQLAFEEIAAALGYAGNEGPMRRCAQAVPLAAIRAMPVSDARSSGPDDPAFDAMQYVATRSGSFNPRNNRATVQWVLSGVRPSNHPRRRLAQLVSIARVWPEGGMVRAVRVALRQFNHLPRSNTVRLRALVDPNAAAGSRVSDVVVNVLLPLARAVAMRDGDEVGVALADAAFLAHASLSGNAVIARVAARIGVAPRLVAGNAAAQQGLIAIWDGPCRPLHCDRCPLALSRATAPESTLGAPVVMAGR